MSSGDASERSEDGGRAAARRRLGSTVLVTANRHKLAEARRLCGAPLHHALLDLPEVQSLNLIEVLEAKAAEAHRRLGVAVIVEETGLYLDCLNGFPGPLIKWLLAAVGAAGIGSLALRLGDRGAEARCALLLVSGQERLIAEGRTRGRLVTPPRGEGGFGWDSVFAPEDSELTYAELPAAVKDRIGHRGRAWRSLLAELGRPGATGGGPSGGGGGSQPGPGSGSGGHRPPPP